MPRQPGDRVRVVTPSIAGRPDLPVCLQFSYDMHGSSMGFLNVYIVISLLQEEANSSIGAKKPLVYFYGSEIGIIDTAVNDSVVT